MERSELQRVFVGFGSAVDKEKGIIIVSADLSQPFCQLLLQFVDNGVGIESKRGYLLAEHLYIVRMCMSDRDYCMTAIEVEVFGTVLVPYMAAFSFDNIDVKKGIYIE